MSIGAWIEDTQTADEETDTPLRLNSLSTETNSLSTLSRLVSNHASPRRTFSDLITEQKTDFPVS